MIVYEFLSVHWHPTHISQNFCAPSWLAVPMNIQWLSNPKNSKKRCHIIVSMSIWSNINYEPVPKRVKSRIAFGSSMVKSPAVFPLSTGTGHLDYCWPVRDYPVLLEAQKVSLVDDTVVCLRATTLVFMTLLGRSSVYNRNIYETRKRIEFTGSHKISDQLKTLFNAFQ